MTSSDDVPLIRAKRGVANASVWSVGGKLVSRGFDIATLIILSTILEPADFGIVAKAMTVVFLVEMITMVPIETPILRSAAPVRRLYDTAFTMNLIRAFIIVALLVGLSFSLSAYFGDERLITLMWWLALAPALRVCISPRMADFTRVYDMRPAAIMDIVSKVISLVLVTILALETGSYWAIAFGMVATSFVLAVLSYIFAPYRPRLSLQFWPEYKDIVTWVTMSQSLQALNWQLDNLILGRMLGNDAFGRYSIAKQFADIPFQALAVPITRPILASFTAAKARDEQRVLWLRYSNGVLFAVGGVLVSLAVLSEDVIFVLLGQGWEKSNIYFAGMALATLPALPLVPLASFAVATFRSRLIALRVFLQLIISVPVMIAGAMVAGALGVIAAKGIIEVAMLLAIALTIRREIGLSITAQLISYWRSVIGFVALTLVLLVLRDLGAGMTDGSRALTALRLTVVGSTGMVIYLGFCILLWSLSGRPDAVDGHLWRQIWGRLNRRSA